MTRVRRLSDGKIFSNPRGVALSVGKPIAKAVYYCCRGYLFSVEGEQYEWVYEESADRGALPAEGTYWERQAKWSSGHSSWNSVNTIRQRVFDRSVLIRNWIDRTPNADTWRSSRMLSDEWNEIYHQTKTDDSFPWTITPTIVTRHLMAYYLFYEKMFGMHSHKIKTPLYKGHLFRFVAEDVDPEFDILSSEVMNNSFRTNAKPVVRLNDGKIFKSMREAARILNVPIHKIFHACEGDIKYFNEPLTGEKMEFRYATEIKYK